MAGKHIHGRSLIGHSSSIRQAGIRAADRIRSGHPDRTRRPVIKHPAPKYPPGLRPSINVATINPVRITFDPAKRERALRERGLDFRQAKKVFDGPHPAR